jgi:hypothetical protein
MIVRIDGLPQRSTKDTIVSKNISALWLEDLEA